jgi:hypothetical protein
MKQHQMFYLPGMISLTLVAILCVWFFSNKLKEEKSIVIFIPDSNPVRFADKTNYQETPFKTDCFRNGFIDKSEDFYLNGEINNDTLMIGSFNREMQHIIESKNFKVKLHVIFGDNIDYGTFIKVLDVCLKNCKKYSINNYFAITQNELWYFYDRNHITYN